MSSYAGRHVQLGIIARWRARRRRPQQAAATLPVPFLTAPPASCPAGAHDWACTRVVVHGGHTYEFWVCLTCRAPDLAVH